MPAVVADTGPLNYLLIGQINLLPRLFGTLSAPAAVAAEMRHSRAPDAVRSWAADPPPWFTIHPDPADPDLEPQRPHGGERVAIALAHALGAGLLLIDDRAGVAAARLDGLRVTEQLSVLLEAASLGSLDFQMAFNALLTTSFRHLLALLDILLAQAKAGS